MKHRQHVADVAQDEHKLVNQKGLSKKVEMIQAWHLTNGIQRSVFGQTLQRENGQAAGKPNTSTEDYTYQIGRQEQKQLGKLCRSCVTNSGAVEKEARTACCALTSNMQGWVIPLGAALPEVGDPGMPVLMVA